MPTTRHLALFGFGFLAVLAVNPAVARAESAADASDGRQQAQVLFDEAKSSMQAGAYAEACSKFQRSLALSDGLGTRFNLADCFERWGKTASALQLFVEVAEATRRLGDPERAALAQERAEALEPRLTRLRVDVPSKAPDVGVVCDGEAIPRVLLGKAMPIDPGEHRVDVKLGGAVVWTVKIGVPAEAQSFSIAVPAHVFSKSEPKPTAEEHASAPQEEPTPAVSDAGPREPDTSRRTVALALGGLGVVGLVGGGAMGLQYLASQDDAKQICRGTPSCTEGDVARHRDLVEDAKTGKNWAFVGFGVGGAALLGAGFLYFTMPEAAGEDSALMLSPIVAPGSLVGGAVRGSF
jgi:hypothetical protein